MYKAISDIQDLANQARCITKAVSELMQADYSIDACSVHSNDKEVMLTIYELLRNHSTCSAMLLTIQDLCKRICGLAESIDMPVSAVEIPCKQIHADDQTDRAALIESILSDIERLKAKPSKAV